MIERHHSNNGTESVAVYSDCEKYRYSLTRIWNPAGPNVLFVMLNPSKATELQNDPTVERCERRARALGFGAFQVANLFAWRETNPQLMRKAAAPIGPDNDAILISGATWADQVIAAWGTHGVHLGRGTAVKQMLKTHDTPVFHLGLSKAGHPRHPLYIPYAQHPIAWAD